MQNILLASDFASRAPMAADCGLGRDELRSGNETHPVTGFKSRTLDTWTGDSTVTFWPGLPSWPFMCFVTWHRRKTEPIHTIRRRTKKDDCGIYCRPLNPPPQTLLLFTAFFLVGEVAPEVGVCHSTEMLAL